MHLNQSEQNLAASNTIIPNTKEPLTGDIEAESTPNNTGENNRGSIWDRLEADGMLGEAPEAPVEDSSPDRGSIWDRLEAQEEAQRLEEANSFGGMVDAGLDKAAGVGIGLVNGVLEGVSQTATFFQSADESMTGAANSIMEAVGIDTDNTDNPIFDVPKSKTTNEVVAVTSADLKLEITPEQQSVVSDFAEPLMQFASSFLFTRGMVGTKVVAGSTLAANSIASGGADAIAFDKDEGLLLEFLNEVPALDPYISDGLLVSEDNPEWQNRTKKFVRSAVGGALGDVLFTQIYKHLKRSKTKSAAKPKKEGDVDVDDPMQDIEEQLITPESVAQLQASMKDINPTTPHGQALKDKILSTDTRITSDFKPRAIVQPDGSLKPKGKQGLHLDKDVPQEISSKPKNSKGEELKPQTDIPDIVEYGKGVDVPTAEPLSDDAFKELSSKLDDVYEDHPSTGIYVKSLDEAEVDKLIQGQIDGPIDAPVNSNVQETPSNVINFARITDTDDVKNGLQALGEQLEVKNIKPERLEELAQESFDLYKATGVGKLMSKARALADVSDESRRVIVAARVMNQDAMAEVRRLLPKIRDGGTTEDMLKMHKAMQVSAEATKIAKALSTGAARDLSSYRISTSRFDSVDLTGIEEINIKHGNARKVAEELDAKFAKAEIDADLIKEVKESKVKAVEAREKYVQAKKAADEWQAKAEEQLKLCNISKGAKAA